ncbi:MAG TPA: prepilin-type N-terminal cleavage/methylation domain-containing protein [Candidatus Babeliales bacterium]|nr:prepilin-type N-terminal cleavage/methylation domain-containing protein [Candidatus Babeliales bacterium]
MKPVSGFILIEVLIAAFIASIIGGALFLSFFQTNRTAKSIDNIIDVHEKIGLVVQQMEHDISGAFIPLQPQPEKGKNQKATEQPKQQAQQPAVSAQQPAAEKKKLKKITHIFYGINKDGMLDTLTFVTNNPMQVYWSARAGKAKPMVARIVYRLVPEPVSARFKNPAYTLMRQEDYNLYFDAYKSDAQPPIRSFELIDGIKSMTIKYGAQIPKKSEKEEKQKGKTKPETTFQTFDEWNVEKEQESSEKKEGKRRAVPHEVEITLSLWDDQRVKDSTVIFKVAIIPDLEIESSEKNSKETQQQQKQQETQVQPQKQAQQAQNGEFDFSNLQGLINQFFGIGKPNTGAA